MVSTSIYVALPHFTTIISGNKYNMSNIRKLINIVDGAKSPSNSSSKPKILGTTLSGDRAKRPVTPSSLVNLQTPRKKR